ncbi:MAG TPA: bifunctional YncE family protein/alkaline phosphatase family protein [Humisphaera sp.]|jgi:YVTN family beta-propeller protein|nr:bifunctional YncE family protein/alkaline phosphatase family protein [Humisphaera sp.]
MMIRATLTACFVLTASVLGGCQKASDPPAVARDQLEQVNSWGPQGSAVLPTQQIITPAGQQVELPGMRPQAIALSPDGALLATSGKTTELVLIDPATGKERQRVSLPPAKDILGADDASSHNLKPDKGAQLSYTGLCFSPDGSHIYLSDVTGSVKVFAVDVDHRVTSAGSIALPPTGLSNRKPDIPAGLAISSAGTRLYVTLNVSNRLLELNAVDGKQLRTFDVGNAPFDVVLTGNKAYVSNWGGRRVDGASVTGPIGESASVRVDPVRFVANEGSVSVIDLQSGATVKEIMVGMHASAMALSPDRRFVVVANANSDSVSVIDTASDAVVENISTKWQPSDLFGCSPNALAFDSSGKMLFVCNGTQNAVAAVAFDPGHSKLTGLIPVGWFPGAIAYDVKRNSISVANIKGVGSTKHYPPGQPVKYNVHQYFGTVSLVALPDKEELVRLTQTVLENCRRRDSAAALLAARADAAPLPVPQRAGEPCVFKHVVYIIKENRTYDQVLGDMKEGNGDASLCIFGEQITPNQHKISHEFVLLDNTYCSGINSAEGHQWTDSAIATDYLERSYAGFLRSYPDGMEDNDVDALAYAPTGFIWDNVLAHGKTLRDYGEFTISDSGWKDPTRRRGPSFTEYYQDFVKGTGQTRIASRPAIESLRHYLATDTVGWNMQIPDVVRANRFITELHDFERAGTMPNLSIICLPNDHTSATKANYPTPAAHVADNDLALGQIVEAISHSAFWKDTCILAIEDDPQAGWDHISAYRTTAYVISPYTKRHTVIHTNYNQPSLLHTIELILGLPPMNALDALATPMGDCFTASPDLTPYDAVPNLVPLDQLNPNPQAIRDPEQRKFAEISQTLPLDEPDKCPEDLLNRILWQAQKGSKVPYPAKLAGKGEARRDAGDRD